MIKHQSLLNNSSNSLFPRQAIRGFVLIPALSTALALSAAVPAKSPAKVSYNRDIRPILSDNCFFCHGPDQKKRKAKLRLDIREEALAKSAFVPSEPDKSELVRRIFTTDTDDQMPPPAAHKTLSTTQKELLRRWIAQGAEYQKHWAYILPSKSEVPKNQNGIDFLVQQRLKGIGLKPSPEADRRTLARRLYFDLIGLPPKPEDVAGFEKDKSPDAYARLVDKLLASEHYGERMAIGWLDVVRYADTIGYHSDNPRNVWPYRDYVIASFNENKPFNIFTREQLAGDLLPNSSFEQKVGSAFNRLLLTTEEGGAQPKDYEARMLTDRVRAVSTVWLGQTIGCAQCHDHKFDPIKSRDFYSLGAFFADIREPSIGRREEGMAVPDATKAPELIRLQAEVARRHKDYETPRPESAAKWEEAARETIAAETNWIILAPAEMISEAGAKLKANTNNIITTEKDPKGGSDTYRITINTPLKDVVGFRLEAVSLDSLPGRGPGRGSDGNFILTGFSIEENETNKIALAGATATYEAPGFPASAVLDASPESTNGWAIKGVTGVEQAIYFQTKNPVTTDSLRFVLRQTSGNNQVLGHLRLAATTVPGAARAPKAALPKKEIVEVLKLLANERTEPQKQMLVEYQRSASPELVEHRRLLAEARKAQADFEVGMPRCLVSVAEAQPHIVRILPRGNFLDETGEVMQPALPSYLTAAINKSERHARNGADRVPTVLVSNRAGPELSPESQPERPSPSENKRLNRLDLADWIISRENPLTARVFMNRLWKQFFGIGLSKVLDDFGMQGEPPINPELLDWLACEFMDSGWDVKHMVRLIVNSHTYKQVSTAPKQLLTRDPYNRELARQSRWRLDAELVRDNALSLGGLLVPKIGGPSVKPYQPEGYWENLNFPPRTYEADTGESQYRRGLYTWWQRSFTHPSLLAFDAPSREECCAERNRSNIPQQALALLNDPTYVEASRAFAARILKEGGSDTASRIQWAWRQALSRQPRSDELATLRSLVLQQVAEYQRDPQAAEALCKVGFSAAPKELDTAELAAWTNVARVILNLHETITRS